MAETVRLVEYYSMEVSDKPGAAHQILERLCAAGVYLLIFSGFPKGRRAQLDFVPANTPAFRAVARKAGWKLVGPDFDRSSYISRGRPLQNQGLTARVAAKVLVHGLMDSR